MIVQPYSATWGGMKVIHRPCFQTPEGYAEEGAREAMEVVRYEALVEPVDLLTGGELRHGIARRLCDRGWGLYIKNNEALRFLADLKRSMKEDPSGITYLVGSDVALCTGMESVRALADSTVGDLSCDTVASIGALHKWRGPYLSHCLALCGSPTSASQLRVCTTRS